MDCTKRLFCKQQAAVGQLVAVAVNCLCGFRKGNYTK